MDAMSGKMPAQPGRRLGRVTKLGKTAQGMFIVSRNGSGFTLIELIVVIAIISVLAALLTPALSAGLERAQACKCQSNIRQLFLANIQYAADHGRYVAAAPDIFGKNLKRWHGVRSSMTKPFDGTRGPLYEYLSQSDGLRTCPSLKNFRSGAAFNAFEDSCGGYGYNDRGVGSRAYWHGYNTNGVLNGMPPVAIRQPTETVMFCDVAYPQPYGNPKYLIEYSFAEAYWFLDGQQPPQEAGRADPTIHFRHRGRANIVWCDGHVSSEPMTVTKEEKFTRYNIGWFGAADNKLFDPF
jgi:prepilin-type N-terminal cleavage/methylation domain-containing protein/prepilin-type processing-associated H-X9-DG protein